MKWHRNLYEGLLEAYGAVRDGKLPPDIYLDKLFARHRKWGKRDREFVKSRLYELLRRKNLWEKLAREIAGSDSPENVLKVFVVAETQHLSEFLNEDGALSPEEVLKHYRKLLRVPHLKAGLPEWLYHKGKETWKEEWDGLAEKLNTPNLPVVRVNTLKITPAKLADLFMRKGYEVEIPAYPPEALILKKPYKLTHTEWYKHGLFEWQDLSSQEAGLFTGVKPGMTVVDACAGAGGKTLQMAAMMQNTGKLYAFDISPEKIERLKRRAKRAGVQNLAAAETVNPGRIERLKQKADVVVVDAPCSGSGTYRRNPHLKWRISENAFQKIIRTQKHVLDAYADMVKPGGYLVYITCSLLRDENEKQINDFLNRRKDFTFVEEKYILPGPGRDGFYMAKLKRT